MPIYEYRCDDCGHDFETIQRFSDDPLKTCPACGKDALRKRMSASAFRLKGGGWYETDFKAGNRKNLAGDDKGGRESGKTESGKTESGKSESGKSESGKTESGSGASASKGDGGAKKSTGESGTSGGESKSGGSSKTKASE